MTVHRHDRIVVLTGAGLSAESGLSTFRDPNGIWSKYDWREVATPEGFAINPEKVHDFYNSRRRAQATVAPNAAHAALARMELAFPATTIVTQNIDALHEAAGSHNVIHMHGEILKVLCGSCGVRQPYSEDLTTDSICPECHTTGTMRPDVVWFGEMPYQMQRIADAVAACDLFISIGTSGNVYPAAGFVAAAREVGAHTVELNLEPSEGANLFTEKIYGPATKIVPEFIDNLIRTSTNS
jgi:NAD-dependent deacetylase